MSDWTDIATGITWLVRPGDPEPEVGPTRPWDRDLAGLAELPALTALLAAADITPVRHGGRDHEVLAWGPRGRRRGWWCPAPDSEAVSAEGGSPLPLLGRLAAVSGGIGERYGEPESRLVAQAEVLTAAAAATDVRAQLEAYSWAWEDEGLTVPIEPDRWCAVAVEGNGNLTLTHRETGQLLLFAPDHDFDDVTVAPGCPEYSLYTIDRVPDVVTWIEEWAGAWSD